MTTLAMVPLLYVWHEPDSSEDMWYADSETTADDHSVGQPEMFPGHGQSPSQRAWLWYRRERWFHEQRVRG